MNVSIELIQEYSQKIQTSASLQTLMRTGRGEMLSKSNDDVNFMQGSLRSRSAASDRILIQVCRKPMLLIGFHWLDFGFRHALHFFALDKIDDDILTDATFFIDAVNILLWCKCCTFTARNRWQVSYVTKCQYV